MNGWPFSKAQGFTKYLRWVLSNVEGWGFTEPFTPTFSVDGFHWGDDLGIARITATITAGAATSNLTLSVPANESWLILSASAQIAQVPAGQATVGQCRLAMTMDSIPMPITEAVNGTTRCGVQSLWTPPYPVLLHPGDFLTGAFFNGHVADLNGTVACLRRRIATSSS